MGHFSETVYGISFWTLFSTLAAQTWFFPLDFMDITGFEVIVLFTFSPFLLLYRPLFHVAKHQVLFVIASFCFALAFSQERLIPRSILLGVATGVCNLAVAARISRVGPYLGFSCFCVALDRLALFSRSSVWTFQYANWALFAITLVAWLWRDVDPDTVEGKDQGKSISILTSISFGSLLYLFQALGMQPTVITRWLGLPPMPLSIVACMAMLLGLCWTPPAFLRPVVPLIPLAAGFAVLSWRSPTAIVLYFASVWLLWRPTVLLVSENRVNVAVALVVWFLHFLGSIWTVAYNFVPFAGEITREQSHIHFYIASALTGLTLVVGPWKTDGKRILTLAMVLLLVFVPVAMYRVQADRGIAGRADRSAREAGGTVRGMIWAVHFGYDNFGANNFEMVERVIRETDANVVGLLESDLARSFNHNWDMVDWLSNRLGMYSDYGPSTLNNTWGCAVLSVFPIVRSHRILLPSPEGELACLLDATLDINGTDVHVFVTHFGNWRDKLDRDLQTREVAKMLRQSKDRNHIYLGYLTNRPYSEHYNELVKAGWKDSAPHEMNRWCQYIFYAGDKVKLEKFYRYDTGNISDTEAQIAHFNISS